MRDYDANHAMTADEFSRAQRTLGWSSARMAEKLCVSRRTVFKYKAGNIAISPPVAQLMRIYLQAHIALNG